MAKDRNSLKDKVALVTGGTRGIGFSIARSLLEREARVFICGKSSHSVSDAIASLGSPGDSRLAGGVCDVRDYEQVRALIGAAERAFGGLDILINNAGLGKFSNVSELAPEDWNVMLETNLSGVFHCCHEAIPLMKRRGGGYIINIGSLAGKNAFPGGAAYNATKFGLIGFSEALMQEVRFDHIRVSYVMPGSVDTSFGGAGVPKSASGWKLQPDDVASVVVSLLEMDPRALASRVELRPSEPRK